MDRLRYPVSSLRGDYIRAALGMAFTGMMLIGASKVPVMFVIIGSIFLLFAGFGVQTLMRHITSIQLKEEGLVVFGFRNRKIKWSQVNGTKLRFFTVKKARDAGWMELILLTSSGKIKIDSSIDGFNKIAEAVAQAVERMDVKIDETSVENFNSLGIQTKSPGLPEAAKKFDNVKFWQDDIQRP